MSMLVRRNKISELPTGLFRKQRHLREIDLPQNEIAALQQGVFRGASAAQILNLKRNHLERLEDERRKPNRMKSRRNDEKTSREGGDTGSRWKK